MECLKTAWMFGLPERKVRTDCFSSLNKQPVIGDPLAADNEGNVGLGAHDSG